MQAKLPPSIEELKNDFVEKNPKYADNAGVFNAFLYGRWKEFANNCVTEVDPEGKKLLRSIYEKFVNDNWSGLLEGTEERNGYLSKNPVEGLPELMDAFTKRLKEKKEIFQRELSAFEQAQKIIEKREAAAVEDRKNIEEMRAGLKKKEEEFNNERIGLDKNYNEFLRSLAIDGEVGSEEMVNISKLNIFPGMKRIMGYIEALSRVGQKDLKTIYKRLSAFLTDDELKELSKMKITEKIAKAIAYISSRIEAAKSSEGYECPNCGAEDIEEAETCCVECGAKFEDDEEAKEEKK